MLKVSRSTSTNTGVAPRKATTSPVAKKVKSGTKTASPFNTPGLQNQRHGLSAVAQVTQCLTPTYSANRSSSSATSFPPMKLRYTILLYRCIDLVFIMLILSSQIPKLHFTAPLFSFLRK